ncbi:hypothetical protein [Streptomyces sp. NPDC059909]|uniref:hypothetical protein n=1 Tax=Streptomyces sp. NPDC059909 TaxID=3346998 RepID=UPI003658C036
MAGLAVAGTAAVSAAARPTAGRRGGGAAETYGLIYADLAAAYREAALRAAPYRQWLVRNKSPLVHAPVV